MSPKQPQEYAIFTTEECRKKEFFEEFSKILLTITLSWSIILALALIRSGNERKAQRAVGWCKTAFASSAKSPLSLLSKVTLRVERHVYPALKGNVFLYMSGLYGKKEWYRGSIIAFVSLKIIRGEGLFYLHKNVRKTKC